MNARRYVSTALVTLLLAACASSPDKPIRRDLGREVPIDASNHRCLALAMYWEARGEGDKGMLAVGSVVMNRVESREFPNTACAVVKQGGETPPCQFSWWCDGRSDVPRARPQWQSALVNADYLLRVDPRDPTNGALFFHSTAIDTPWRKRRQRTARIGGHVFYR